MKIIPKLLLYYSLVVIVLLFVVGLITSRSNSSIFAQLLFLPVLVYFALSAFKRNEEIILSKKRVEITIATVLLVLLLGVSINNIRNKKSVSLDTEVLPNSPLIFEKDVEAEVVQEQKDYLMAKLDDPNSFVNIRSQDSVNSEVIAQGLPNQIYEIVDHQEKWYKIVVDETLQGWVHGDFVLVQ